jgi:hypothetical protein
MKVFFSAPNIKPSISSGLSVYRELNVKYFSFIVISPQIAPFIVMFSANIFKDFYSFEVL